MTPEPLSVLKLIVFGGLAAAIGVALMMLAAAFFDGFDSDDDYEDE